MTSQATFTQEDLNMRRLYHDLMKEGDIPSILDYGALGPWLDTATKLYHERVSRGVRGFKESIVNLQRRDKDTFSKLVVLTSEDEANQETSQSVGILLSDVKPIPVDWFWKGRLALRKLHLLDGDPGLGKTTLLLDIAARLTKKQRMPEDDSPPLEGGVVLISLEDGLEDTLQPRLARAGADLTKIVSIGFIPTTDPGKNQEYPRPFNLANDLDLLEQAIKRVNAKLVIIDPIMAVIGSKDTYKDNEVRAALAPLQGLAEKMGVAVVMIRHFTKNGGEHAIYRGGGSIAFMGLSRIGLMVTKDPDDENKCILANIKNNLAPLASSLSYIITTSSDDLRPYIEWQGKSAYTVQELMGTPTGANRQEILKLLREKGKPMAPTDVWKILVEDNPDLKPDNVTTTMYRMKQAGQLESLSRGQYSIPPSVM